MRADGDAVVKVNYVLVEQTNAAAGNGLADGTHNYLSERAGWLGRAGMRGLALA